jgi:hypothetical protein
MIKVPGVIFTTLHFLCSLRMGQLARVFFSKKFTTWAPCLDGFDGEDGSLAETRQIKSAGNSENADRQADVKAGSQHLVVLLGLLGARPPVLLEADQDHVGLHLPQPAELHANPCAVAEADVGVTKPFFYSDGEDK